jgi:hypothetical protein
VTGFLIAAAAYVLLVCLVIRVLRSAKARHAVERDTDRKDGR